jgi:cysteine-S-conjugate beta-lyase
VRAAQQAGCRALALQSPSKTFNIAGLASCTVIASDDETGKRFRGTLAAGNLELPNLLSLVAAEAAYSQAAGWLDELIVYLDANFRFLESYIDGKVPGVRAFPLEGTYIAWLDFRDTGLSDDDLDARLKRDARVRLNEGRQFGDGGSGFQRLNFACPRSLLEQGLERIERAFRQTGGQV